VVGSWRERLARNIATKDHNNTGRSLLTIRLMNKARSGDPKLFRIPALKGGINEG